MAESIIPNTLNEQFPSRFQAGIVEFPATSTGVQSVNITFPHEFAHSPIILCVWQDANVYGYMDYVYVYSASKTGCGLRSNRKNANYGWNCRWVAIDIS